MFHKKSLFFKYYKTLYILSLRLESKTYFSILWLFKKKNIINLLF